MADNSNYSPDVNIRRNDLLCGRLVAMPTLVSTTLSDSLGSFSNVLSVDFPSMPDTIELMRSADYDMHFNISNPDGIHTYKGTKPLEIPISFKLHAFDNIYCKQGALTLLQLAARLHSFILPISNGPSTTAYAGKPAGTDTAQIQRSADSTSTQSVADNSAGVTAPITCWLYLMATSTADNTPGISAIGYVNDVGVKLSGPWLRGPNGSFNLPSSGEFSFTFVHQPSHGNTSFVSGGETPVTAAFADDVKSRLYNTRSLVARASYVGFASNPSNATTDATSDI